MSKFASTALAIALGLTGLTAQADAGVAQPWLVRARAVNIESANGDSTGLGLTINDKTIPELDVSYFFAPNLAAELILTVPQKHTLYAGGAKIGTLRHLPPTLTLQYHFAPSATFRPYVGAGLNYTRFSSVNFEPAVVAALAPSIKKNSYGLALQAGADIAVGKDLVLNIDVKKVQIETTVYSAGNAAGKFKVDPLLLGVGLGWRF